jgi:hypothetical protein
MSDDIDEPHLGLDSVAEPVVPPPNVPDEKTQEEAEAGRQEAALMQKMASSPALRSIVVSEREVARLKKELDNANSERFDLHCRVLELAPENALLQQSMHDMRGNFTIAALLLTGGSISVSIAGAISNPNWKPIALIAGITAAVIGFILTVYTFFWVKPRPSAGRRRHD